MIEPLRELGRGAYTFVRGLKWLKKHPFYLLILFVPSFLGLALMLGAGALFLDYRADIVKALLFEPGSGWLWTFVYFICKGLLYLGAFVLALLLALLTVNIFSAPLYELVSIAIEKELRGKVDSLSFGKALLMIPEELKRVLLIVVCSMAVFLIPGLNAFALLVTAFLLGWDVYDYPMARRGWSLRVRLACVFRDFWAILGLGLWLIVPPLQFLFFPLAVVGGTLLNLERTQGVEKKDSF